MIPPNHRAFCRALPLALALLLVALPAAAVKVQVRGTVNIDARAVARGDRLEVHGVLKDDTGRPLGQARIRGRLRRERNGPIQPIQRPTPCSPTTVRDLHLATEEILVDTDGAGSFCVSLATTDKRGVVSLEFDGDRYYEHAEATIDVDSSRRSLALSFSPEPHALSLESETQTIRLDTRLEPAEDAPNEPLQLRLLLEDKSGARRELARAAVPAGERALLKLSTHDLGQPGPASLIAEFAGSDAIQPARRIAPILRTLLVTLSAAGPVSPADPRDGADLTIAVGSALGAVPGGAVEALVAGESVGAAPVSDGFAHVVATFSTTAKSVPVTLRYLPNAEWYKAGPPISLEVPVSPPSPLRRLPWIVAALAVGLWVVRTWWRPPRTEKPDRERISLPPGRPSLDVIELGPAHSGWRGRVLDGHDGTPLEGVRVSIFFPSFGGDGLAASDVSDQDGRFELAHVDRTEGARLQATARWHATFEKPIPPPGQVVLSLVSRRRALLGRLVDWANRMGRPWASPGDPTPGHVARVAEARQAGDVGAWADAVESSGLRTRAARRREGTADSRRRARLAPRRAPALAGSVSVHETDQHFVRNRL